MKTTANGAIETLPHRQRRSGRGRRSENEREKSDGGELVRHLATLGEVWLEAGISTSVP